MNFVKDVWNKLNGKKTWIGLVAFFVLGGSLQIGLIDQSSYDSLVIYVELIIGTGVAHKLKKAM